MRIYFDKANLLSFLESELFDPKKFALCNSMLRNHLEVHLNMLIDDFAEEPVLMDWLKTLMEDGVDVPQCINSEADRFPSEDSLVSRESFEEEMRKLESGVSTIFCLDSSDADTLADYGNCIITDVGGELSCLSSLRFEDDDPYTLEMNARKDFVGPGLWNPIERLALPCTDIILVDAYILCNTALYENNLLALIKKLSKCLVATHLNIVIYSLRITSYNDGRSHFEPDWESIRKSIKEAMEESSIDASITYVCPETTKDFGEHDRTIITNYRSYNSGATLNFYNKDGNYTSTGRYVYAKSLAKKSHWETTQDVIMSLQNLINDIKSGVKKGAIHTDSGTKLSNYLTF